MSPDRDSDNRQWQSVVGSAIYEQRERSKLIMIGFEQTDKARLRQTLLAVYHCRRGCELCDIWQSPLGVCFYVRGYKLSPARAEMESDPRARERRTVDGFRRWPSRGGVLDDLRGSPELGLLFQCDHFKIPRSAARLFADIDGVLPGEPTRRTLPE